MSDGTWDNWEEELETIRDRLSEKVKDMTPEEWAAYSNARAEPLMKEFNMKWATLQPIIPYVRRRVGEEAVSNA